MMKITLLLSFFFAILGFFFGSFLNVLIDRLPRGKTIFVSRSVCEECNKKIAWYDLFPVVSYLILGGKCRNCNKKIPLRLLVIEIVTGLMLGLSFLIFSLQNVPLFQIMFLLLIIFGLLAVFFVDYFSGLIPDVLVIYLLVLSTLYTILFDMEHLLPTIATGFGIFLFFLLVFFITRQKGIGFGDVKFSFVIGMLLGFPHALLSLYISFLTGGFVAGLLLLTKRKKLGGDTVAFGPFLVLGVLVMLLFSQQILELVYDLLL